MKTARSDGSLRPQTSVTVMLAAVIAVVIGAAVGLGSYTFVYAKGGSYLGNDPNACANCHIMRDHLDGWYKSSHRSVATCNDCHTPAGFVPKYFTKAEHGFFHSLAFTTGDFHDPIQIKELIGGRAWEHPAPWRREVGDSARSEERRVGKECTEQCRSRWSPYH